MTNSTTQQYIENVNTDYRHNLKVFVLFDLIWGIGLPFAGMSLISAFMVSLDSSKAMIGFYSIMPFLLGFWQIINSHLFRARPKKRWLTLTYSATVLPWFLFSVFFFFFADRFSKSLMLWLFLASQFFFWVGAAGNEGVRYSMLTQCTPVKKRGTLFGARCGIQVVFSLLLWPVAFWLMKQWPEPVNYLAAFSIATFCYMLCGPTYLLTREHQNPEVDNSAATGLQATISKVLGQMLSNRHYRLFLINGLIVNIVMRVFTFLIVFAKEQMELSASSIIHFSVIQMVAGASASILLGKLADRVGYRLVGILQSIPLAAGFLIVAFMAKTDNHSFTWMVVGFFLCCSSMMASRMVFMNMAVEIMPKVDVGLLISLSHILITPLLLIIVPLGGWMVDVTGSYTVLFILGAALTILSGLGYAFCIKEPRQE